MEIRKGKNKFFIGENGENPLAEITFFTSGEGKITIEHTIVSESLKGQGIGQQLVEKVVEYARKENMRVIPQCAYAKKVMTKSDEYRDVLINE